VLKSPPLEEQCPHCALLTNRLKHALDQQSISNIFALLGDCPGLSLLLGQLTIVGRL